MCRGLLRNDVLRSMLLCLQPTRGRITIAGEDLRTFDKSEWARVVSIVNQVILLDLSLIYSKHSCILTCFFHAYVCNKIQQEPVLFSVSVGENIAYGLPDEYVSKDDVIKAAKAANAHDFIISLPQVCHQS